MVDTTTSTVPPSRIHAARQGSALALTVLWSADEPERAGEVALLPRGEWVLGRGDANGSADRARFLRQRPGINEPTAPLGGAAVSRRQLGLRSGDTLEVENLGRCELLVGGRQVRRAQVSPGDLLELPGALLLRCTRRPRVLPPPSIPVGAFGRADDWGIVGETPTTWALRERLAFVGRRGVHVLVLGPSGAGKELAARAIHETSGRAEGPFVARNAATIPASLADAELFGAARDYPNVGAPARPGLLGAAHGGTLFLDELGEMDQALQARLLRVLDEGGYHRLGDPNERRADVRLVAATNREPAALKHDVRARLKVEIEVPGLAERAEDVPLLARHLLAGIAADDAEIGERFIEAGWPRMAPALVSALCRHPYTHHVRELEALLWQAIGDARGGVLELSGGVKRRLTAERPTVDPRTIDAEQLQAAVAENVGDQAAICRALGLRNRFQLYRLLKRHGIDASPS